MNFSDEYYNTAEVPDYAYRVIDKWGVVHLRQRYNSPTACGMYIPRTGEPFPEKNEPDVTCIACIAVRAL